MRLALALLLSLSGLAHADDDTEPVVTHAGEANLEPKGSRTNIQFTGALGGAVSLGFSMTDANGSGGALSLRMGEPMTPEWVLNLEVATVGQLHRLNDVAHTLEVDQSTALLVGASYYPNDSLFLRFGLGGGNYIKRDLMGEHHFAGVDSIFGAGLEVIKVKHFTFDVEIWTLSLLNRDGLLTSSTFCLGMTIN